MLKRNLTLVALAFVFVGGVAVAGSGKNPIDIIGNVFLQDATPGSPQSGHAAILGTFRAGRVSVTQLNEAGAAIIGNNSSGRSDSIGGSFSAEGMAIRGTALDGYDRGIGVVGVARGSDGIGVLAQGRRGLQCEGTLVGIDARASTANSSAGRFFGSRLPGSVGIEVVNTNQKAARFVGDVEIPSGIFSVLQQTGFTITQAIAVNTVYGQPVEFFKNPSKTGGRTRIGSKEIGTGRQGSYIRLEGGSTAQGISYLSSWESDADGKFTFKANAVQASIKNFVEIDPADVTKDIVYACVEGPEAAAYVRGVAKLVNGSATVRLPEHFKKVVVLEGMTVQLTPMSPDSEGLCVVKKGIDAFEVRELRKGHGTYEFDWEVKAVRQGYTSYRPVRNFDEGMTDSGERANALKTRQLILDSRKTNRP